MDSRRRRREVDRWRRVVGSSAGVVVGCVGVLVTAAWFADIDAMKSIVPGLPTMKINTAASLAILGWTLTVHSFRPRRHPLCRIGRAVSGGVAALATVTLATDLFDLDLGLDDLVVADDGTVVGSAARGRMSPATATGLLALGLAMNFQRGSRRPLGRLLAGIALAIAGADLIGYLYSAPSINADPFFGSMAIHTATGLALLAIGFLARTRDPRAHLFQNRHELSAQINRLLLPAAIVAPVLLGWIWLAGLRTGKITAPFAMTMLALSNTILLVLAIRYGTRVLRVAEHDRARSRRELHLSERRLRQVIEDVPVGVAVLDDEMRYVYSSRRWREDFGLEEKQIVGRSHYAIFPEIPERWREIHRQALAGVPASCDEDLFVTIDGQSEWLRWAVVPWRDEFDRIVGIVIFNEVITVRKENEAKVAKTEEQLRQAQRMEAIGRLAGGVAHDFNNLLTVILGYASILRGRIGADAGLETAVSRIDEAGTRAQSLTRQLLAFSRRQVLMPDVLDLNEVVRAMQDLLKPLIGETIEVAMHLQPEVVPVEFDRGQLEQIVMNLALNARDAMPQGGTLLIETRNVFLGPDHDRSHDDVKPGVHAVLVVSDTGEGMDAATRARIFEPFFTTKAKGEGTGLGLATVYGIVKQSGGDIWVYSEPGGGTTFKVYLPRSERRAVPRSKVDPSGRRFRGDERILVVEDEEGVREFVAEILSDAGYDVLATGDPDEAIRLARDASPPIDLMLSDVVLPKMDGRSLRRAIAGERGDLAVLFMSGYTDDAISRHGVLDPGVPFIEKPFSSADLLGKIRGVLGGEDRPASSR
ncbi:MAG: ATP-binding protein [Planctomycetota bacterium]